jgi:hypothetical protein
MKKLSFIFAMALAAIVNYSCGENDNAVNDGNNVFKDADGNPHSTELVATLQGTPGTDMEISFSTYEDDYYVISSGDYESLATEVLANDDIKNSVKGKRTSFTLTVGDNGIIKIYGNSKIKTLYIDGGDEELILPLNQPMFSDLQYLQITKAKIGNFKIPALEQLGFLYIQKCIGLNNLDLSEVPNLDTLYVRDLVDSKLTSLDLSKNTELENIWIAGTASAKNALKTINLRNNTNLIRATISYNELSSINLGGNYENLTNLTLTGNNLTELNFDGNFPQLQDLYVNINKLSSLDVTNLPALKTLNVSENYFTFATLPTENVYKNKSANYANQAKILVTPVDNIVDLSNQVNGFEGYEVNFSVAGATEGTDYLFTAPGIIKFIKKLDNVVISITNEYFPGLTIETEPFNTAEPSNEVFAWHKDDQGEYIVGGSLVAVPAISGVAPYTHKIGFWQQQYATIVIDGTKETLAKENFNYIRVNLDEPLKEGMKVSFTGFSYADQDIILPNLFLLIALPNYVNSDTYPDYLPDEFDNTHYMPTTIGWNTPYVFDNIKNAGIVPNTFTFIVDDVVAGSKSFKMVLGDHHASPIYLTKIQVLRQ